MCRRKTYPPGAEAKPPNHSFSWAVNPRLLIKFFPRTNYISLYETPTKEKTMSLILAPFKLLFQLMMFILIGPFWLVWMLCKAISGRS